MVVAMIAVLVMQMPADQVIDMAAVRNRLVPAVGAVFVFMIMLAAAMIRGATFRIVIADADTMFVYVVAMQVVQVAVVQIIDMSVVPHRGVPAVGAVLVRMTFMRFMLLSHTSGGLDRQRRDFNVTATLLT
ncbi:MAG TPA: hypothetical protein VMB85_01465 [Bryobacteraceae bacterium]|nr:hypothetical protein [Bryobacteraceae bacterium]